MSDDTPLLFLRQAHVVIDVLFRRKEMAFLDVNALKQIATERSIDVTTLVKQSLHIGSTSIPIMAFRMLTQLDTLVKQIESMQEQIEVKKEVIRVEGFHVLGFERLVRDILLSLQYVTQIFPDVRTSPEYKAFLEQTTQLARFLETQYIATSQLVRILQHGSSSGRFFDFSL